jgi:hypothetical protein
LEHAQNKADYASADTEEVYNFHVFPHVIDHSDRINHHQMFVIGHGKHRIGNLESFVSRAVLR